MALPCWLALLCSSPLKYPRLNTIISPGTAILCFVAQTMAVLLLSIAQIFVSVPSNRYRGMDMRAYEITRNRDDHLKRYNDGSHTEYAYIGENLCGRRAIFGSLTVYLDQPGWSNFMLFWAVVAIVIWVCISLRWGSIMVRSFYLLEGPQLGNLDVNEGLPAMSCLQPLFRDGELPERQPCVSEDLRDQGFLQKESGWGIYLRYQLNFQFVLLKKWKMHFTSMYGLRNPLNIPYLVLLARIAGFIVVVISMESTVTRWKVLFGQGSSLVGNGEGDFSSARGSRGGVIGGNGALVLVMGVWALVSVVCGWLGEMGYWRVVGKIGDKISTDKGGRRRTLISRRNRE